MYEIARDQLLDEKHLLSLMLVIENGTWALDIALKSGDRGKVASIAHFARLLTETVQCFGSVFGDMKCYKVLDDGVFFTSFVYGEYYPVIAFTSVKCHVLIC